ncbi:3-methyl-2-indolic acid synthase [Nocardia sp. NBC_00508]|uniref:3-methyl-2-indolic acid synthase n=1 Tax=Nocardia sp. NBC_00508 TaxID=2975992 RepID=UPI002E817ADC|nr:3-methyl-2-indolic acid synthase [Nocardia sp. NBC_00508]WUD66554.1 3-methyl-2-indolic acid synthase [Nocardia sp. NBC_00508]
MTVDIQVGRRFHLPELSRAAEKAQNLDVGDILGLDIDAELPDDPAAVALALIRDTSVSTEELRIAAERRIAQRSPRLHTFVPLYTTNHCDSECKMCGMKKSNTRMIRKLAGKREIEDQLRILLEHEGVAGVGFLTGEYEDEYTRQVNAFRIGWAIRTAFDMGFQRVYFNIGSMTTAEIETLGEWIDRDEPVTMCVFQETYDRHTYERFMGSKDGAPKADYDRRIQSFDRWLDAGFKYVNPGALIGLHDIESEMIALVSHATYLARRGGIVDISLPRLRPAMASSSRTKVDDQSYIRLMAAIAFVCPDQRLVLTNREGKALRDSVIDLCGVISPGSPDVAPYRRGDDIVNEENSSQFLVADLARPSTILKQITDTGRAVQNFAPDPH